MKKHIFFILLFIAFICGLSCVGYPLIAHIVNDCTNKSNVDNYNETIKIFSSDEKKSILSQAREYNKILSTDFYNSELSEAYKLISKSYSNILNFNKGIMCYISIPKIDVNLPVYHNTETDVLTKGVAHLKNSSFPVGGQNTHCVLSAHSGYPSQRFFDDLDELEINDLFYIHILDETLIYKVMDINVVKPDDSEKLKIVKNKDLITLVTCYPYSINTHRLLVTGERVYNSNISIPSKHNYKKQVEKTTIDIWIISLLFSLIIAYIVLFIKISHKGR